jgi:hypothetical protein
MCVCVFQDPYTTACACATQIIIADNLTSLALAAGLPAWLAQRDTIILALGLGLFLPMCLLE